MDKLTFNKCSIMEVLAATDLVEEYADESAINNMPRPSAQRDLYKNMESSGLLTTFGAFKNSELIGFVTIISSIMPHYGAKIAVTESFFVSKQYRKNGVGTKLLRIAERYSKETGAIGLLISAPADGRLSKALSLAPDYALTNQVFFKRLDNV